MQILKPYPRSAESEVLGVDPAIRAFKPSGDSDAHVGLTGSGWQAASKPGCLGPNAGSAASSLDDLEGIA